MITRENTTHRPKPTNLTHPREKKGFFLPFAIDVAAPFDAAAAAFRFDGDTGVNN